MKVTLIKQFKNHNVGEILDVSMRVKAMLRQRGAIALPVVLKVKPDRDKKKGKGQPAPAD